MYNLTDTIENNGIHCMHSATLKKFTHSHEFGVSSSSDERRTLVVVLLTFSTMIVEILFGCLTGSMALLANGWHMGTHAFALGISYSAYLLARKFRNSEIFSFGTGKFGILAGYTSALFLGGAALWMIYESIMRIFYPVNIAFNDAIWVTVIGLSVNLVSVLIMHNSENHDHHDHGEHKHHHEHDHGDHNYRAAYLHVIADTVTSVFALVALLSGRFLGWAFLDPVVGIAGGIMILRWAVMLLKSTSVILLDGGISPSLNEKIREIIESDKDSRVADLHAWRISSNEVAAIISIITGTDRPVDEYQSRLKNIGELVHVSIEIHRCSELGCLCKNPTD